MASVGNQLDSGCRYWGWMAMRVTSRSSSWRAAKSPQNDMSMWVTRTRAIFMAAARLSAREGEFRPGRGQLRFGSHLLVDLDARADVEHAVGVVKQHADMASLVVDAVDRPRVERRHVGHEPGAGRVCSMPGA